MLKENLQKVMGNIAKACLKAGRKKGEVKIIAVSKNQTFQSVLELHDLGISDFGENRIQEAGEKIIGISEVLLEYLQAHSELNPFHLYHNSKKITWHFIGRLQTNKAKKAVELFELIHSVDSLKLAEKINSEAEKRGKTQKILLQMNISSESTKAGFSEGELKDAFPKLLHLSHLAILGLMTIAPISENAENSRAIFANLRAFRDNLELQFNCKLPELSMGMSQDFEVAIEEGTTMVRIGTALFRED